MRRTCWTALVRFSGVKGPTYPPRRLFPPPYAGFPQTENTAILRPPARERMSRRRASPFPDCCGKCAFGARGAPAPPGKAVFPNWEQSQFSLFGNQKQRRLPPASPRFSVSFRKVIAQYLLARAASRILSLRMSGSRSQDRRRGRPPSCATPEKGCWSLQSGSFWHDLAPIYARDSAVQAARMAGIHHGCAPD